MRIAKYNGTNLFESINQTDECNLSFPLIFPSICLFDFVVKVEQFARIPRAMEQFLMSPMTIFS